MPRTIRKRQLRNKKSRKQRGGNYTDAQKKKIEEIQKTINDSIEKLLIELGKPEPQQSSVFNFSGKSKVSPENNDNTSASVNNNITFDKENNNGENVEISTNNNAPDQNDVLSQHAPLTKKMKSEPDSNQTISGNTVVGV